MDTDEIKVKFQSEIKWGSYFFIFSVLFFIVFALIMVLVANQPEIYWFYYFVLIVCFFYISFKCFQEIKLENNVKILSSLGIGFRIFIIHYMLSILIFNTPMFIIPKHELEILETNEQIPDSSGNLLKSIISFIKVKIS